MRKAKPTGKPPYAPGNPQVLTHESWGAYLEYCEHAEPTTTTRHSRSQRENESWCGTANWEQAISLARAGWKDGENRVRAISRKLEARLLRRIVREEFNYDVEGISFDLARYLADEPEHWIRPEESTVISAHGTKHVKIIVNVTASSGVTAESITARGAAIASLVELLEYGDHRCEVWAQTVVAKSGDAEAILYVSNVKVKAYDQPLDMGRLAFALAHPSMLRRLHFSNAECADPSVVAYVSDDASYGIPGNLQPNDTSVYLPSCQLWDDACNWTDPASVESWTIATLIEQGIVLRDD